ASLKAAFADIAKAKVSIRPLLIRGEDDAPRRAKVLIYRSREGLGKGYTGLEQDLPSLDGVAAVAKGYVSGTVTGFIPAPATRDILVCTHASNDKCCGAFGYPFYREVVSTISLLGLPGVRVWQSSHLGGHRFAPTIVDFPQGRYYGALDRNAMIALLTRMGDISIMNKIYRGSARLPLPAQILERELMLRHGWEWLDYAIAGKVLAQDPIARKSRVEIAFQRPDGTGGRYEAEVVVDEKKTVYLTGDCHAGTAAGPTAKVEKFSARDIRFYP
ncbi:MAG: sucrase ferredoxin, partial [Byssovorax sp.]